MSTEVFETRPEILVSFQDFAKQENVSLRTVQSWAKQGRIETVRQNGKRFVNSSAPMVKVVKNDDFGNSVNSRIFAPNVLLEKLLATNEGAKRQSGKAKSCWQFAFFAVAFLLAVALAVAAGFGSWGYQKIENQSVVVETATADLASMRTLLAAFEQAALESAGNATRTITELTTTVGRLNNQLAVTSRTITKLLDANTRLLKENSELSRQLTESDRQGTSGGVSDTDLVSAGRG